jgi:hypothetical protein
MTGGGWVSTWVCVTKKKESWTGGNGEERKEELPVRRSVPSPRAWPPPGSPDVAHHGTQACTRFAWLRGAGPTEHADVRGAPATTPAGRGRRSRADRALPTSGCARGSVAFRFFTPRSTQSGPVVALVQDVRRLPRPISTHAPDAEAHDLRAARQSAERPRLYRRRSDGLLRWDAD